MEGKWQRFPIVRFGNVVTEPLDAIWEKAGVPEFSKIDSRNGGKDDSGSLTESLLPDLSDYLGKEVLAGPRKDAGFVITYTGSKRNH